MVKRRTRSRTVLVVLAAAGAILLAPVPSQSVSPLPLRCEVAGWVTFSSSPDLPEEFFKAKGLCSGDLQGPYSVVASGSGGGCLQLLTTSGTIEPCIGWRHSVTLKLTSQSTGRIQTLRQIWEGVPSPYSPNVVFSVFRRGGGPIGAGFDSFGDQRWCGPLSCQYDYSATWIFKT